MALLSSCWLTDCRSRHSLQCPAKFENRLAHSITSIWEVWEPVCRPFASCSDWQLKLPLGSQGSRTLLLNSWFSLAHSNTQRRARGLTNFKSSGRLPSGVSSSPRSICCERIEPSLWENLYLAGKRSKICQCTSDGPSFCWSPRFWSSVCCPELSWMLLNLESGFSPNDNPSSFFRIIRARAGNRDSGAGIVCRKTGSENFCDRRNRRLSHRPFVSSA